MSLDFDTLRKTNVARCNESFHPGKGMEEWTPTDWATAMASECGEACNVVKKMRRLGTAPECSRLMHPEEQHDYNHLVDQVGAELADLIIYADLLAARLGIDLGNAVTRKFNQISAKVKSGHLLPEPY